ncbi:SagB/ThcOx family dehydrogenase [Selenomonas sp.]|uniref:SagB/ThcOx family dehydrogenase n=1 Tax=Selenomonas sp. TaxID=2053611 RepID=UPI002A76186B|nr:SagB/ThcOx family dehydrogenase [Selenomonas sp.]MDY3298797.1 SagB/ThcOx family dehydrogenase [Selenomonas sp.]
MEMYEKERAFLADTMNVSPQDTPLKQGAPVPPPEKPVAPGTKVIALPEAELLPDQQVDFLEMIELRASVRQYKDEPITRKELAFLLWTTQGVKMPTAKGGSMRTVPSAGARHAFETYLYVQRVEGLAPGFYRYLAYEHLLLPLHFDAAANERFIVAFRAKGAVTQSAVTFVWAANIDRLTYIFGKRAYRYAFLDAGHVCQNLYLAAWTQGIGCCAMGAFDDAAVNDVLGLDGEHEFAIYGATVGKAAGVGPVPYGKGGEA